MLIADLASTALGAGIAITAGVVAAFVQFWLRRKERAEERSAERQDRAAAAVGPTLSLLRSLDPQPTVAVLAGNERAREVMDRYWSRWDQAQDALEIIGAGHPSPTVREACDSAASVKVVYEAERVVLALMVQGVVGVGITSGGAAVSVAGDG